MQSLRSLENLKLKFWTFPRCSLVPNNFPQTSQAILFWWIVLLCLFRHAWVLKVFPQLSQIKGLSVWWTSWCVLSVDGVANLFSHLSHSNGRFSGNWWWFKWEFNEELVENVFPHSPHSYGRSPVWIL